MRKKTSVPIAVTLLALAGCTGSIIDTDINPPNPSTARPQNVIGYYALPRANFLVEAKCTAGDLTITVGDANYIPDTSMPLFQVRYNHSAWSNDTANIQIDKNGLLSGASATGLNQTVAIVGAVTTLVTQAAGVHGLSFAPAAHDIGCSGSANYDVKTTVDPALETEHVGAAHELLSPTRASDEEAARGISINVARLTVFSPRPENPSDLHGCAPDEALQGAGQACRGLYFRPLAAFKITVTASRGQDAKGKDKDTTQSFIVFAPDPLRIYSIPFDRKTFTQFNVQVGFDKGMLTKFQSTDDSEVLAALGWPASLIKDITGLDGIFGSGPAKK
jgi:hypothetical protein